MRPEVVRAHGRRELGVVGVELPLDLVEQALLVLGERHKALLVRSSMLFSQNTFVRGGAKAVRPSRCRAVTSFPGPRHVSRPA